MDITQQIKKTLGKVSNIGRGSLAITDERVLSRYRDDSNFPYLVSFPRTGSHWLRMLMELYFERPSLVRVFYYPKCRDYLCLHTHDLDLDVYRKNIVYLYRDPVQTIFSQMMYEKEDICEISKIQYWASLYARHLQKWLILENKSEKKTVVRYENMQSNLQEEFEKITDHFDVPFDPEKCAILSNKITKDRVKSKTTHDHQVVDLTRQYVERRQGFIEKSSKVVWDALYKVDPGLKKYF